MSVLSLKTLASFEVVKQFGAKEIEELNIPDELKTQLSSLYAQDIEIEIAKNRNFEFLREYFKFLESKQMETFFHRKVNQNNVFDDEDFFKLIEFLESIPKSLRAIYMKISSDKGTNLLNMKATVSFLMYAKCDVKLKDLNEIQELF